MCFAKHKALVAGLPAPLIRAYIHHPNALARRLSELLLGARILESVEGLAASVQTLRNVTVGQSARLISSRLAAAVGLQHHTVICNLLDDERARRSREK